MKQSVMKLVLLSLLVYSALPDNDVAVTVEEEGDEQDRSEYHFLLFFCFLKRGFHALSYTIQDIACDH